MLDVAFNVHKMTMCVIKIKIILFSNRCITVTAPTPSCLWYCLSRICEITSKPDNFAVISCIYSHSLIKEGTVPSFLIDCCCYYKCP